MDAILAARLNETTDLFEPELFRNLAKVGREYAQAGTSALNYYVPDLDAANDLIELYAPTTKEDFEKRDRNSPKSFIHPMAATEIWTLATFVSQILFGGEVARKVEAREDSDEKAADLVNELLAWNDNQQPTYNQGFLWIKDALTFNRGVMYERWQTQAKIALEPVEEDDLTRDPQPVMRKDGTGPRLKSNGQPYLAYPKRVRFRKKRVVTGGYNHIDLVSPYDFICDPELPMLRFQEGRFAGHRVMIPWGEIKRRSELDPADPSYVLPTTVKKLKNRKQGNGSLSVQYGGSPTTKSTSRSYYERQRRGSPVGGMAQTASISKEDGGVVECFAIILRGKPSTYGIYDDHEDELIEVLMSGETDLLSVNVLPNVHDQFPYAVGESRPNAHYQFSPGWALVIKPIQDFVDYLKNRHAESIARTSGNIFIGDPTKVDFEAFLDPNKDGLFIPITQEGMGTPLDQIVKQVAVTDTTKNFYAEMEMWIKHAEVATGAHSFVQGETEDVSQTATQFVGVQQMATGRISSVARLLSCAALIPQTRRFVCNFQQFMPDEMVVRITQSDEFDPDVPPTRSVTIRRDDIQCEFDFVPSDGAMPGTDAKKVAALTRMMEASANPAFGQFFDSTVPGNMDAKAILFEVARAGGMPVKHFLITREQAQRNLAEQQLAAGMGTGMPPGPGVPMPPAMQGNPPGAPPVPMLPTEAGPIPSAEMLPAIPSVEPSIGPVAVG